MVAWSTHTDLPEPSRPMDGRVHTDGTDTEYSAARSSREPRGQQRRAILDRFREVGEHGSTDFENYEALKFVRPHVAGTRREELQRDGWPIVDSGGRRPTDTGRPAIVWKLATSRESSQSGSSFGDDDPQHASLDAGRDDSRSVAAPSKSGAALPPPESAPDSQLALPLSGAALKTEQAA